MSGQDVTVTPQASAVRVVRLAAQPPVQIRPAPSQVVRVVATGPLPAPSPSLSGDIDLGTFN